jgi:outer membrane murein-binding lipoprotein Lpp
VAVPTLQEQYDATVTALHNIMLAGGVTSYSIGDRHVTKDVRLLQAELARLAMQINATSSVGTRTYATFTRSE